MKFAHAHTHTREQAGRQATEWVRTHPRMLLPDAPADADRQGRGDALADHYSSSTLAKENDQQLDMWVEGKLVWSSGTRGGWD